MPVYKFSGKYSWSFDEEEIEAADQETAERQLEAKAEHMLEAEELHCTLVDENVG